MHIIDKFLDEHPDKDTFTKKLNINFLKGNLILDENDNEEMQKFSEILIVLSTLGTNKETYLERMEQANDDSINYFVTLIDKYIKSDKVMDDEKKEGKPIMSLVTNNLYSEPSFLEDQSVELQEKEEEILNLKQEILTLTNKNNELNFKLDNIRYKEEQLIRHEEEMHAYTEQIKNYKSEIMTKDSEIEELKQIININSKKYNEENNTLKAKLEALSSLENETKNLIKDNENYKNQIKELLVYKTKSDNQENFILEK